MHAAKVRLQLAVNGKSHVVEAFPMSRLLDVLREELKLTGSKEGCGEGECGACSVWLDGKLVNSCLVPAIQAHGSKVRTIEGIGPGADAKGSLHPVQQAFLTHGGAQCGICTPGMVAAAVDCLERHSRPAKITDAEIRQALAGNLCRCTGYTKIFDAVRAAGKVMGGARGNDTEKEEPTEGREYNK